MKTELASQGQDLCSYTGPLKGSTLTVTLCYCHLDILNTVFSEGPHLFISHGAQEGRLPVLCAESSI